MVDAEDYDVISLRIVNHLTVQGRDDLGSSCTCCILCGVTIHITNPTLLGHGVVHILDQKLCCTVQDDHRRRILHDWFPKHIRDGSNINRHVLYLILDVALDGFHAICICGNLVDRHVLIQPGVLVLGQLLHVVDWQGFLRIQDLDKRHTICIRFPVLLIPKSFDVFLVQELADVWLNNGHTHLNSQRSLTTLSL